MVLTTEQRIELLKKAREAKAKKKEERDALKPTPVKGRPKKEAKKTLDLVEATETTEVADEEIEEIIENVEEKIMPKPNIPKRTTKKKETEVAEAEAEPEVVEQVEVRKIKKPKRRIVRKIIKEEYDSESTEEEIEEVVYVANKHRPQKAKVKEVEMPREQTPPREPEIRQSKPTLNIFGY